METAFGVRLLGTALVVISGFYRFPRQRTRVGFLSDHCRRIEVDYQSGSKQPHSKGSADLYTGQRLAPACWGLTFVEPSRICDSHKGRGNWSKYRLSLLIYFLQKFLDPISINDQAITLARKIPINEHSKWPIAWIL